MLIYDLNVNADTCNLSVLFDIGYICLIGCEGCIYLTATTLLAKLVNKRTRGTMFAFRGWVGSIFTLIYNGSSGYLYDHVSKI